MGVGETGWDDRIEWSEGGWGVTGRGRPAGEEKGGMWVIVREEEGTSIQQIKLTVSID